MGHKNQKLKAFAIELEHLMKKHEVCGFFGLASKDAAEFNMVFAPWSLIQFEKEPAGRVALRIRTRKAEKERTDASFHALYAMRDMAAKTAFNFQHVIDYIDKKYPGMVEHHPFTDFEGQEVDMP